MTEHTIKELAEALAVLSDEFIKAKQAAEEAKRTYNRLDVEASNIQIEAQKALGALNKALKDVKIISPEIKLHRVD